ncbi:MAG: hypothetical protein ABIT01_07095 [Thermoanaerobaculia bacterium]
MRLLLRFVHLLALLLFTLTRIFELVLREPICWFALGLAAVLWNLYSHWPSH